MYNEENRYEGMFDKYDEFLRNMDNAFSELDRESNELFVSRLEIMFGGEQDPEPVPQPDASTVPLLIEALNRWWCN